MTVEDNLKLGAFAKTARGDSAKNLEFVYELFPRMKERMQALIYDYKADERAERERKRKEIKENE